MKRLSLALLAVGLVGILLGVSLTALGGGHRSGCAAAHAAVAPIAAVGGRVDAGTAGAADMRAALRTASAGLNHAASQDDDQRRSAIFRRIAVNFDGFRLELQRATSWQDPQIQDDLRVAAADGDDLNRICPAGTS